MVSPETSSPNHIKRRLPTSSTFTLRLLVSDIVDPNPPQANTRTPAHLVSLDIYNYSACLLQPNTPAHHTTSTPTMAAGLKTIIALSFVRPPIAHFPTTPPPTIHTPLTHLPHLGPRHRLPPRDPLLRSVAQLPPAPRRRHLRGRAAAKLDLRPVREPR